MTRRIIGVLLAVILAALGTGAVLYYVAHVRNEVAAGQKAVRILVAVDRIPAGTTGAHLRTAQLVTQIVVPAATVPDDALSTLPADLDTLVLTSDAQPRQILMRGMFGQPTTLSGGLTIPEGMVAVTVQVGIPEQVAGYVRPGSQVAVFVTYTPTTGAVTSSNAAKATRVLLPRAEVIATGAYFTDGATSSDQNGNGNGSNGDAAGGQTMVVTLAVVQLDAERLIQAVRTGDIYFALLTDSSNVKPGPGVTSLSLFA
jgi:pilus assembly protein CpaB